MKAANSELRVVVPGKIIIELKSPNFATKKLQFSTQGPWEMFGGDEVHAFKVTSLEACLKFCLSVCKSKSVSPP